MSIIILQIWEYELLNVCCAFCLINMQHGKTAMTWAARGGHIETIRALLPGGDFESEDEVWSIFPCFWSFVGQSVVRSMQLRCALWWAFLEDMFCITRARMGGGQLLSDLLFQRFIRTMAWWQVQDATLSSVVVTRGQKTCFLDSICCTFQCKEIL